MNIIILVSELRMHSNTAPTVYIHRLSDAQYSALKSGEQQYKYDQKKKKAKVLSLQTFFSVTLKITKHCWQIKIEHDKKINNPVTQSDG